MNAVAIETKPQFNLGNIYLTPGAIEALAGENPGRLLKAHQTLEMGELSYLDYQENLLSVREGFRIFSAFRTANGTKIWIISEAVGEDGLRERTVILTPSEY